MLAATPLSGYTKTLQHTLTKKGIAALVAAMLCLILVRRPTFPTRNKEVLKKYCFKHTKKQVYTTHRTLNFGWLRQGLKTSTWTLAPARVVNSGGAVCVCSLNCSQRRCIHPQTCWVCYICCRYAARRKTSWKPQTQERQLTSWA